MLKKVNYMKNQIKIDFKSPVPIYEQIKIGVKAMILGGTLKKAQQCSSIRELTNELKANQNTTHKAYYQLDTKGFVYSKPGQGYFVRENLEDEKGKTNLLFDQLTDEYIKRSINLGFSLNMIIEKIKKYRGK